MPREYLRETRNALVREEASFSPGCAIRPSHPSATAVTAGHSRSMQSHSPSTYFLLRMAGFHAYCNACAWTTYHGLTYLSVCDAHPVTMDGLLEVSQLHSS